MGDGASLVDTSVINRGHQPVVAEQMRDLALRGRLRSCGMVDLEVAYTARSRDVATIAAGRGVVPTVRITQATMEHALDIMKALAAAGLHRGAKPADCIIAACALESRLPLLHYDRDFDRIAKVTDLDAEWVAPPGSLDAPR